MARLSALLAAIALSSLSWAHPARAEDPNSAEAEFQRGRVLLAEGRYADACKAFETSQAQDPASGTLLALAYCQELSGLLASAWSNYRAAAELAQREGQAERRDAATDQSRALAERVSVLTIVVPPSLAGEPGLKVTLDGNEVAKASLGKDIPVNGGTYRIEAAVGQASWSATVAVESERDKKTIVIEMLPPRRAEPSAPVPPSPPPPPAKDAGNESRTLEHVGLATAITGLVGVGVGFGFGLVANSKHHASQRDGHCDERGCDSEGMELENDAIAAARVSTWCIVGGSVVAVGGVALYFGTKSDSPTSGARLQTTISPTAAQLLFTEAF